MESDLPDEYEGWQLDLSQTQTNSDEPRCVTYITRVDGHRYSIFIEEDGGTFGGALIDHVEPIQNPHRTPITSFTDVPTLEDAIGRAQEWMENGVEHYLNDMETDFRGTESYD